MAKPVCRVLIPDVLERAFPFVVTQLELQGLKLCNPYNKKITTWTECGDQREICAGELLSEVLSGFLCNLQFWGAASEDVFVSWSCAQGGCIFSIYLDGVNSALAVALVARFAEVVLTNFKSDYGGDQALTIEFH